MKKNVSTMTQGELKDLERSLRSCANKTKAQRLLASKLEWIGMIDSCFCYGMEHHLEKYLHDQTYDDLPVRTKRKIMEEHLAFLHENAVIKRNVGTDSEGVAYNSMTY